MQPNRLAYLLLLGTCLSAHLARAQTPLPLIRATSARVAINDGGTLDKNAWALSPKTRPDVYTADRTRQPKWVTFYTDLDSIRVRVKPGTRHDFIVLLNGKDSCYTRIESAIAPESVRKRAAPPDTIPFTLTAFNAIHVRAVLDNRDTLNLHFDTGSSDCRLTKEAILKKTHLLPGQTAAGTEPPNFNRLGRAATLQLGTFVWEQPRITATDLTAQEMDGRFGYNLFEGRQVEIDYDHNWLLIHSRLPKTAKQYAKTKLVFRRSSVGINANFVLGGRDYEGDFLLDTGSSQAIIVDSDWAGQRQFPDSLPLLKTSVLRNPRGDKFETRIVLAPLFRLGTYPLANVPTSRLGGPNPARFSINFLGNDVLKRFNLILDFKNDYLYLKPNKWLDTPYRERS